MFIMSVRRADWELHILATKGFTKYFFAHDKLNYARMIPVYLSDMASLKESDTSVYQEFVYGNWIVNKNSHVPFCAIGADHALEQLNRPLKVAEGLVGITLDESAGTKLFLIAPELSRLVLDAKDMIGLTRSIPGSSQHALFASAIKRQDTFVDDLSHGLEESFYTGRGSAVYLGHKSSDARDNLDT